MIRLRLCLLTILIAISTPSATPKSQGDCPTRGCHGIVQGKVDCTMSDCNGLGGTLCASGYELCPGNEEPTFFQECCSEYYRVCSGCIPSPENPKEKLR